MARGGTVRLLTALLLLLVTVPAGCGGGPAKDAAAPAATRPRFETRWLRGISATEVMTAARTVGLACVGPKLEGGASAWTCESATPLVGYRVRFYGSAPLKLEYITATITQTGVPKADLVGPLFVALAGLHYDGGDAPQARAWVLKAIDAPGETTFGPGKFRVSGNLSRLTLDMKAIGADW
jgi:hypothetical protein